jgi:hypothetical protein
MFAAVLAALVAATAPAATAAVRSDHPAAAARDGGWTVLGPWRALEQWLGNLFGADTEEGEGGEGGEGEGGSGGSGGGTPPPDETAPPTCPPGQTSGPCNDPSG